MRKLVILISKRARKINKDFLIVPQNALELITVNGKHKGKPALPYIRAIDGVGCEELYFGYKDAGVRNTAKRTQYFKNYLVKLRKHGKTVLVTDYVKNLKQAEISYKLCKRYGFISFQAERTLSQIPSWQFNDHDGGVSRIKDVKNFLYLINPSQYDMVDDFINSIRDFNADILIIDAFFEDNILSMEQVDSLKKTNSGKRRLALAYLSIGEAEDYRYYWKQEWKAKRPLFLEKENINWKGNYKVKYWMDSWKEIICGRKDGTGFDKSYLKMIIDAGFDGVYLDIIDAAFYFEDLSESKAN